MSTLSSFLFPPLPSFPILSLPRPKPLLLKPSSPAKTLTLTHCLSSTAGESPASTSPPPTVEIAIDNAASPDATSFEIRARSRIGLLQAIAGVFKVLGLRIERASVESDGGLLVKRFFVVDSRGRKIEGPEDLARIERALRGAVEETKSDPSANAGASSRGIVMRKAGLGLGFAEGEKARAEVMFGLMDGFLKNDVVSLQKDILDHVEYTMARSRFSFDDFEAYQ